MCLLVLILLGKWFISYFYSVSLTFIVGIYHGQNFKNELSVASFIYNPA